MSYDQGGFKYYLSDGVYWNWDNEKCEDNHIENSKSGTEVTTIQQSSKYANTYRQELIHQFKLYLKRSNSISGAKNKLFKLFLRHGLRYMVYRFSAFENLPSDYAEVSMQDGVLLIIIEMHIKKLGLQPDYDQLNWLVNDIYKNKDETNVYLRVSKIQSYVHSLAILQQGDKGHINLNKEIMRRLLSVSRLHLQIDNLKRGGVEAALKEIELNEIQQNSLEPEFPEYLELLGKRYIKNWNKRHLRSLLYYAQPYDRQLIAKILKIESEADIEEITKELE